MKLFMILCISFITSFLHAGPMISGDVSPSPQSQIQPPPGTESDPDDDVIIMEEDSNFEEGDMDSKEEEEDDEEGDSGY